MITANLVRRNLLGSSCRLRTTTTPVCSFAPAGQPRHRPVLLSSSTHLLRRRPSFTRQHVAASSFHSTSASLAHRTSPSTFLPTVACLAPYNTRIPAPHSAFTQANKLRATINHRSYASTPAAISSPTMTTSGDSRSKRKQPQTPSNERPMKQIKTDSGEHSNGSDGPNSMDIPLDIDDGRMITRAPTTADTAEWQNTVQKVIKNVVSIHFCQTCSFDTDPAVASEATGFVVDAEKGYILTNRVCWMQRGRLIENLFINMYIARCRRRPLLGILHF